MENVFSFNISDIFGILITAGVSYIVLIILIRILGKRSTSKLNSFDWIVTVSIGSIFASTVLLKDISLFEGCFSIFFLLALQYITTKLIQRYKRARKVVKASPSLLLFKGEFIENNLKRERVLEEEIYAEIRQKGLKSISQIYAIVLETNSKISVIPNDNSDDIGFSLRNVSGLPESLKDEIKKT